MAEVALIGFGEAASAFAADMPATICAYDRRTNAAATRAAKLEEYRRLAVVPALTNEAAVAGASLILSLVTADQALAAGEETARSIASGALFCDMNSVSPETKRAAAEAIEEAGGCYADVAVMAPVHPKRRGVPLLVAGPHAERACRMLGAIGFEDVRSVGNSVGAASAIKMIRSVMVKGLEALTAECLLAAEAAGVRQEVIASLDASERSAPWAMRADYNLDRMMVHGIRRAEEMVEVVKTLEALGTGSAMSRGTLKRQRAIGELAAAVPDGLDAKLATLLPRLSSPKLERAA